MKYRVHKIETRECEREDRRAGRHLRFVAGGITDRKNLDQVRYMSSLTTHFLLILTGCHEMKSTEIFVRDEFLSWRSFPSTAKERTGFSLKIRFHLREENQDSI